MGTEGGETTRVWASTGDLMSNDEAFDAENLLAGSSSSSVESAKISTSLKVSEFSNFGDSECGEPMRAQHLVIDFTFNKNIDTEDSQQKVSDFWAYINSRTDIQHLMVVPDPIMSETGSVIDQALHPATSKAPDGADMTAVSTLELCDDIGATSRAFDMKVCTTKCTQDLIDYCEDGDKRHHRQPKYQKCDCAAVCKCTKKSKKDSKKPKPSSQSVMAMCSQLDKWDKEHPKPMDPPGPIYQHLPILQRKLEPPI